MDNADSGHAQRAVQAVLDNMPQLSSRDDFWQRVQRGCALSNAGTGTAEAIGSFDIDQEIEAVLSRKRVAGRGSHSDYCRVAGCSRLRRSSACWSRSYRPGCTGRQRACTPYAASCALLFKRQLTFSGVFRKPAFVYSAGGTFLKCLPPIAFSIAPLVKLE